ncbi:MAG: integrase family protein [Desulfurivibrionaceae bacterium]
MNKAKLTKITVEKLPFADKGKQIDYYDTELDGFGVRVSATGKKYFVRAHIGNRRVRVMLKGAKLVSAEEARKEALAKLGEMAQGVDPNQVERDNILQAAKKRREEKQQSITLQAVLNDYLQKGKLKPRTVKTYHDLFRLYLADWLDRPATEITRDMVKHRHQDIATGKRQRQVFKKEAGSTKIADPKRREGAADNCFRTLRAVLNYAFEDEEGGTLYENPVTVLSSRKRKAWFKVDRRRTLIKNSDLPAWSKAVEALDNPITRDFLLFLIHTGLRRNEAAGLRWDQVDFQEGCFTIPDTKNGEPHTLPLSDYLINLLMKRKAVAWHGNPYVFPSNGKSGYLQEPKRAIDAVTVATGITFTCHDLRRTFATIAESLDLSGYTVKALLNHKQQVGDVTGGYIILNVDRLREPMQKITDAIQERIRRQHGQVVPMQATANK